MPDGLNRVEIIGNLGKDPEMRYTANGTAMTRFPVAVGRTFQVEGERREETEWFNVVAWNKTAEITQQYLTKGSKVYVEGRLSTRSWDTPEGQKRYMTELVAGRVIFLDSRPSTGMPDIGGDMDPDDVPFEP
jgi:single-strand DNA-binding protein